MTDLESAPRTRLRRAATRLGPLVLAACAVVGMSSVGAESAATPGSFPQAYNPETATGYTNTFTPPTAGLNPRCPNAIAATPGSDPASLALNPALNGASSFLPGGEVHYVYADNPHGTPFNFTIQTCAVAYPAGFFQPSDFDAATGMLTNAAFAKHDLTKGGTQIDGASLDGISDPGGDIYFSWTVQDAPADSWVCAFARDIRANHGGGGNRKVPPICFQVGPMQTSQTVQGEIYACVNGAPSTTLVSGGTVAVPSQSLSSANPLAATQVPDGTYTMSATAPAGQEFVACGQSGVSITSPTSASRSVTVPAGGSGDGRFYAQAAPTDTGYLEVCKSGANSVSGNFSFYVSALHKSITVPAGACSRPLKVPAGVVLVEENRKAGYEFVSVSATPADRVVNIDPSRRNISVRVEAGGVAKQVVVTFTNRHAVGTIKVCQLVGAGVARNTPFDFTSTATNGVTVPAGSCAVLGTAWQGGTVTVSQQIPAGDTVSAIGVRPGNRLVGSPDLANGSVGIRVGPGVTEVTYTDTRP